MPTSPEPCTTPNEQVSTQRPNPITQSPSTLNCASASVNSSNGLDLLSSVVADDVFSPANKFYDDGLINQAPVVMSPSQAIVPAVTQTSPTPNCQTAIALFQDQAKGKCQCSTNNGANIEKRHKSWKGTHNSKTSMMLFLCDDRICATAEKVNGQAFSTNGLMCRCYSGFGRGQRGKG